MKTALSALVLVLVLSECLFPSKSVAQNHVKKRKRQTLALPSPLKILNGDLRSVDQLLIDGERSQRSDTPNYNPEDQTSLLNITESEAQADTTGKDIGQVSCIDNGIIARVNQCNQTSWGKVDLDNDTKNQMNQAFIKNVCTPPEKQCALTFGYQTDRDGVRTLFCANSSTKTCNDRSRAGQGVENLSKDLIQCRSYMLRNSKFCQVVTSMVAQQAHGIETFCSENPKGLSRACANAVDALRRLEYPPSASAKGHYTPSLASDILYVGDSHTVGCLGDTLNYNLRKMTNTATGEPERVRTFAACGFDAGDWIRPEGTKNSCAGTRTCSPNSSCTKPNYGHAPSIGQILNESQPKTTVVELGSNMLKEKTLDVNNQSIDRDLTSLINRVQDPSGHCQWNKDAVVSSPKDKKVEVAGALTKDLLAFHRLNEVAKMVCEIKDRGSKCIWIGPPQVETRVISIERYEDYVSSLRKVTKALGCEFIDSDDKTDRTTIHDTMGMHYAGCDDKHTSSWGQKVFDQELSHEIPGATAGGTADPTLNNGSNSH